MTEMEGPGWKVYIQQNRHGEERPLVQLSLLLSLHDKLWTLIVL